jgi:beta-hydroxylase
MYLYDPEEFSFLESLKVSWRDVLEEYRALGERRLHPWPEGHLFRQKDELGVGWDVFGLWAFGKKNVEGCEACPFTAELVEAFPEDRAPCTVAFSRLRPGAHILPHSGYLGYSSKVLRAHLGLEIPEESVPRGSRTEELESRLAGPGSWYSRSVWHWKDTDALAYSGCCLRVGPLCSLWAPGEMLVFDDSHVHEAWNMTESTRVVLLLDFKRPPEYLTDLELVSKLQAEADAIDPMKDGNRGETYLDRLTDSWGYKK